MGLTNVMDTAVARNVLYTLRETNPGRLISTQIMTIPRSGHLYSQEENLLHTMDVFQMCFGFSKNKITDTSLRPEPIILYVIQERLFLEVLQRLSPTKAVSS
jgi:hypothetical protein